jgi:hypothetical protein
VGTISGNAGDSVDLPVSFTPGGSGVATLQFDLAFPAALNPVSTDTGAAALAAGKTASGSVSTSGVRILIFGLNQNTLGAGRIAVVRFAIAAGTSAGALEVSISNIVASSAAGGNIAATGINGSVIVNSLVDIIAPVISAVMASSITQTSAIITWTTDEPANSQIEYGATATYGSVTALDASMVTSHMQALTGLSGGSTYHYRVKSTDGAGNGAVSEDRTFATSDRNPLEISNVTAVNVTSTSATITWTTNNAANSQVMYGTTLSLGSSTTLNAANVTSHSQVLTGLSPATLYHFKVKSQETDGEPVISADHQFLTKEADESGTTLFYPRMLTESPMMAGDQEYTGLAIANLDSATATLKFTAYNASGNVVTGDGITNPVTRSLLPGQQLPIVDNVLFGALPAITDARGWIKIESNVAKVAGFFLMFNGYNSELDGAVMFDSPISSFVFSEIRSDGFTKINVGNPNEDAATLVLSLTGADGSVKSSVTREIAANGALVADLFQDIFRGFTPDAADYVKVTSTLDVLPYQLLGRLGSLGRPSLNIQSLTGHDANAGSVTLHAPQFLAGGMWRSSLSVVNLEATPGTVTFRYFKDDGTQIGVDRVLSIAARGKIYVEDSAFFEAATPADGRQGYVEITSGSVKLTGSVVFGDVNRMTIVTALPLTSALGQALVFSHVSSNDTYYTGLAVVNPNAADAQITVSFYNEDGSLALTTPLTIPAHQRFCKLLTQIFPALEGRQLYSGYFKVASDRSVASFAVFGTRSLTVLSAIPPQIER